MTASIKRSGARAKHGMANEGELLLNVVIDNKPKMLRGLNQKVRERLRSSHFFLTQTTLPPAERQSLTHAWYICGTWETGYAPCKRNVRCKAHR